VAIALPQPRQVQAAVKQCILSLVVLDAALCLLASPWYNGVVVLALLIPALLLGKWVYST
jgi:4-hydroxybenzoate polyprenyltransferase